MAAASPGWSSLRCLAEMGQPKYRASQVWEWIYGRLARVVQFALRQCLVEDHVRRLVVVVAGGCRLG